MLDLAGAPPLPSGTGHSLRPVLEGQTGSEEHTVVAENILTVDGQLVPCRMVRRGPWKFNYYHGLRPELFHVVDDPEEMHDHWDDPACAEICNELKARALRDWNPEYVRARVQNWCADMPVIGNWVRAVKPEEPDTLWFTDEPENWHLEVSLPMARDAT